MKKFLAVLVGTIMLASMLAAAAGAQSFNSHTHWNIDEVGVINVKKADPANVVKDGVIGENEYERYYPDLNPDTSYLHRVFMSGENFLEADQMLATMEYYFSWDEVHGFNFAVRNTPVVLQQHLTVKDQDPPEDDIAQNTAYVFCAETVNGRDGLPDHQVLYYVIARNTDTLEYLEGHYDSSQLGMTGAYDPTPDVDYCITYSGGTALVEWSIPFEHIDPNAKAGSTVKCSIEATAGVVEEPDFSSMYAIVLGDMGFGLNSKVMINHASFLLSDETIGGNNGGGGGETTATPTQTDSNGEPVPVPTETDVNGDPVPVPTETDVNGDPVPVPTDNNNNNNNGGSGGGGTAPRTGDPMIIIAAVSALGACGAVVIKRKFF